MTIIFTAFFRTGMLQASDRLVAKDYGNSRYRKHDTSSNKSLVYVGINCRLVLGFTGEAYVQGMPTDVWLVEQLYGAPVSADANFSYTSRPTALDAKKVLDLLEKDLPVNIRVSVGGYQETRRGLEPRYWEVERGKVQGFTIPHHGTGIWAAVMPWGWHQPADIEELTADMDAAKSGFDYRTALAACVRRVSARNPNVVGSDVMMVAIDGTRRHVNSALLLAGLTTGKSEIMFTPAAVFPNIAIPSARINSARSTMVVERGAVAFGKPNVGLGEYEVVWNINLDPSGTTVYGKPSRSKPPTS